MRYTIGLREANQHLAKHIKAVEAGHDVIITRRPAGGAPDRRCRRDQSIDRTSDPAAWQAAYDRMLQLMETAPAIGGERDWTRDEIYVR
jgi:antitoxin (DNA-binding transcriptional repressor) of toxin-antitoxin stability system